MNPSRFATVLLLIGVSATFWPVAAHADQEQLARKLINSQGCKACHSFEGAGSQLAGSLEEASKRLTAGELQRALVSPDRSHGNGRIPDFRHLQPEEIEALVTFLKRHSQP